MSPSISRRGTRRILPASTAGSPANDAAAGSSRDADMVVVCWIEARWPWDEQPASWVQAAGATSGTRILIGFYFHALGRRTAPTTFGTDPAELVGETKALPRLLVWN